VILDAEGDIFSDRLQGDIITDRRHVERWLLDIHEDGQYNEWQVKILGDEGKSSLVQGLSERGDARLGVSLRSARAKTTPEPPVSCLTRYPRVPGCAGETGR